jgi:signal transduction histidine kinase
MAADETVGVIPEQSPPTSTAGLAERVRAAVRDPERLEVLRRSGLLEMSGGEPFDRLTEFASEWLRTPVAMITLIGGERQRRLSAVIPADWPDRTWDPVDEALEGLALALREPVVVEAASTHPLLRHSPFVSELGVVSYAAVPLRLSSGVIIGAVSIAELQERSWSHRDIELLRNLARAASSEIELAVCRRREKQLEAALERASTEIETVRSAGGEFLSSMSHELRTPLNSILGYVERLNGVRQSGMSERQAELLQKVGENSRNVLDLVNDVLRLSRIHAGLVTPAEEAVELEDLLGSVTRRLRGRKANRAVALRLELPERVNPLWTDRDQLFQIVSAMVGNALKFTLKGEVKVRTLVDPGTMDAVGIQVIDTGPGIPADRLEAVFRPFEQAGPDVRTRTGGGTGLGLPIAQALAEGLGYHIRVESQVGVGTTFTLELDPDRGSGHL